MPLEATAAKAIEPDRTRPAVLDVRLPRRAFLQVAGLSAAGLLGAGRALGSTRVAAGGVGEAPSAAAADAIETLAAELDYDVERIFRFVADEVRYEPYAGILRGARGTLAGRAGNSADQALLLGALLGASGVPVRFVTGALDDSTAEAILAGAATDLATAREQASEVLLGSLPGPAVATGPLPAEVGAILDRLPEVAATARAWAEERLDSTVRLITDALAAEGITLPTVATPVPGLERERHAWVQVAAGPDWIDLDPALPGAQAGEALATAAEGPLDALPDDLRHRVELALTAERLTGSGLAQDVLLEHAAFADELHGVPVTLLHDRPEGIAAVGVSVAGTLTGTTQYLPILQVGERMLIGLTGLTFGGGGGLLGDMGGETSREGEATAEWLEVSTVGPEGSRETARRTLFDRVGAGARAAGPVEVAAIPAAELVELEPGSAPDYPPARTLHFLSVTTGGSDGQAHALDPREEPALALLQRGGRLYQVGREALATDLGMARGVRSFHARPGVVSLGIAPATVGSAPGAAIALDILHRDFGNVGLSGSTPSAPAGLLSGVLSHVAERLAMGEGLPDDLALGAGGVSVGALLEAAAVQSTSLRVLQDAAAVDALGLPPDVGARLRERLADGWVAVAPAAPVELGGRPRFGWWLVDPRSGRALDEMDDGRRAALLEKAINYLLVTFRALPAWMAMGICVFSLTAFVGQLVMLFLGALMTGDPRILAATPLLGGVMPGIVACAA